MTIKKTNRSMPHAAPAVSRAAFGAAWGTALVALALLGACSADATGHCPSASSEGGVLAPLGACTSEDQSRGGSGGTASGGGAASGGASTYANFATVTQIVQVKCGGSGCHSGGGQAPLLLGVDNAALLSTLKSYVVKDCGNHVLVKPGSPDDSAFYLVQKGACGQKLPQMPLGCSDETCTPPDYVEGVRQWIANGAPAQ